MVQSFWETVWHFLKRLNIKLLYDSTILFLDIEPRELNAHSYKNMNMNLYSTLFITAKKWKQCRCPPAVNGETKCGPSQHLGQMLIAGEAGGSIGERVPGNSVFPTQFFYKPKFAKKSLFKNVVYQYNRILPSHKKNKKCYNDEP